MKQKFNYTSIETIFAKFSRDLRDTDLHEGDLIEWTAEALEFLKVAEIQQEAVFFGEVKNHTVEVPLGFQSVIQVAKYNNWKGPDKELAPCAVVDCKSTIDFDNRDCSNNRGVITDCRGGLLINDDDIAYYRPYFDLQWEFGAWSSSSYYKNKFSPVKLANHSFFNSVVCKETDSKMKEIYDSSTDEYTIAGGYPNMSLRFSFKEGYIAMAYLRSAIDSETGYPLIPDDISHITAITYYIRWKMAERLRWSGREGFVQEARDAEEHWLKYVRQAINKSKMPQGIDQYQNLMEQSFYLVPNHRKFSGYFGNISRFEGKKFNKTR